MGSCRTWIPRIRTRSTPNCSTASSSATTSGPASASAFSRRKTRAARRFAGTGTRRSSSRRISTRALYFGAQFVYRSDDRGNTWKVISPDLTRQLDRNTLPVMGRVWGPDAVAKNTSTALYGNISAIAESPKKEGPALRRDGRRRGSGQRRRGRTLAEGRQAARRSDGGVHRAHSRLAARRRHRLRRRRESPERRLRAVSAQEHGQRPHLEVDRRRSPGARLDLRDRRRSRRSAAAVRRHGVRGLLEQGRRSALDQDCRRSDDRRARNRDPEARERSRARHIRPRRLHRRRLLGGPCRDTGRV